MSKKPRTNRSTIESCEAILAVLKAGQRQLEYLAHEHLDFRQVLKIEQNIRVGSSPERAEIQRIRLLLDARLDHVAQMRALSSLAPLTLTPMDEKRFKRVSTIKDLRSPQQEPSNTPESGQEELPEPQATEAPAAKDVEIPAAVSETMPEVASSDLPEETVSTAADLDAPSEGSTPLPASDETQDMPVAEPEPLSEPESQNPETPPTRLSSHEEPSESEEAPPQSAAPIPLGGVPIDTEPSSGLSIEVRPASTSLDPAASPASPPLEESLKTLMELASQAHSDGELERAIEAYSDLLDQVDTHLPALLARGRCLLEAKDHSAALSDFRRAQQSFPSHPAPLIAIGDLFMARKEHSKAIEFFDQAIGIKPDHPQARCRRGLAHYHCGRYRQAFLDLQRAYKLDPEIPNIRRLVQMAIRKLEDSD